MQFICYQLCFWSTILSFISSDNFALKFDFVIFDSLLPNENTGGYPSSLFITWSTLLKSPFSFTLYGKGPISIAAYLEFVWERLLILLWWTTKSNRLVQIHVLVVERKQGDQKKTLHMESRDANAKNVVRSLFTISTRLQQDQRLKKNNWSRSVWIHYCTYCLNSF